MKQAAAVVRPRKAVVKSAASAPSVPPEGRASGRLDHGVLFTFVGRASAPPKKMKISDSVFAMKHFIQGRSVARDRGKQPAAMVLKECRNSCLGLLPAYSELPRIRRNIQS